MQTNSHITKAIIPVAGKGTRLLPLTKAVPKELIPLGKKPVLEHVMDEVAGAGISEVLFVISHEKTAIRDHFGDQANGVRFTYTFQEEQKGLADAVYCAKEFAGSDPIAVILGDSLIYSNAQISPFKRTLNTARDTGAKSVILVQNTPIEEVSRYGIVKPKGDIGESFEIDGLVEKPKPADAPSRYAIAGRYTFGPEIFDYIERTPRGAGGEYQLTDSIGLMLQDGLSAWVVALSDDECRRDIGTFETYFEAFQLEIDKEKN